ncbi:MAG: YceD family protein [Bacteroidota bacterium]|jgi:uncharacterized metal-binding protein YceD (DUF177 family)
MGRRREYDIAFVGLKPGIHEFNYPISDKFFVAFQEQDFKNCKANVRLVLEKQTGFFLLTFEIGGMLEVTCDRCNGNLPLELWDEFKITVKMVEEPELMNEQEEDPDVFYISRGESHLNVEEWIYDFINLSLPMQKACGFEKMDGPYCNKAALELLKKMKQEPESETEKKPIWKGLDQFKNLS